MRYSDNERIANYMVFTNCKSSKSNGKKVVHGLCEIFCRVNLFFSCLDLLFSGDFHSKNRILFCSVCKISGWQQEKFLSCNGF